VYILYIIIELFNSRLRIKSKNDKHNSLELQNQQSLIWM